MAEQHSAMRAFPSQTPSLEQMFSGQNQRAAIEVQIESVKLLADQRRKLDKMNEALNSLSERAAQHQMALQQREKIEEQRYKENTRYSRIAAWAGVISTILAAIAIFK